MFDLLREKAERDGAIEATSRGVPTAGLSSLAGMNGKEGRYFIYFEVTSLFLVYNK